MRLAKPRGVKQIWLNSRSCLVTGSGWMPEPRFSLRQSFHCIASLSNSNRLWEGQCLHIVCLLLMFMVHILLQVWMVMSLFFFFPMPCQGYILKQLQLMVDHLEWARRYSEACGPGGSRQQWGEVIFQCFAITQLSLLLSHLCLGLLFRHRGIGAFFSLFRSDWVLPICSNCCRASSFSLSLSDNSTSISWASTRYPVLC